MPRLIDAGAGDALTLEELDDLLARTAIDIHDEDAFAALGPALARLGRNRTFLADVAVRELKARCRGQEADNRYGAQVLLLRPPRGSFVLRANLWPSREDRVVRASGTAAFFYDLPHDHNFPFLTYGYLGPGYWSDYYTYDASTVDGVPGAPAGLRFVERARLEPSRLMLYRMRHDVHVQLPPDAFSVSLNILGFDPGQPWIDQHRFDIRRDVVAETLTATASEALLTLGVHLGMGDALDLAESFAVRHPCDRMRWSAVCALANGSADAADRYAHATADPSRRVRELARQALENDPNRT